MTVSIPPAYNSVSKFPSKPVIDQIPPETTAVPIATSSSYKVTVNPSVPVPETVLSPSV